MNTYRSLYAIVILVIAISAIYAVNLFFNKSSDEQALQPSKSENNTIQNSQSTQSADLMQVQTEEIDEHNVPLTTLTYIEQTYPGYTILDIKDKYGVNDEWYEIVITQESEDVTKKIDLYYDQKWNLLRTKVVK